MSVSVHYSKGYKSLRAERDFRQGETIIELPIRVIDTPDKYSIEVLPGIHLDCGGTPAGCINHSCEPNAAVRRNVVIAWNCIKKGEFITIDYKKTEEKLSAPFDCRCGSKFCRGRIE